MRPTLEEGQLDGLRSQAEARFYRACRDQLDPNMLVLHSVRYVDRNAHPSPRDGEADFVVCDPEAGFVVVEVKGGGVRVDSTSGRWSSVSRSGQSHLIKNPFDQAMVQKKVILDLLRSHADCPPLPILAGHAAFFPDVRDVTPLVLPQSTREMVGGYSDLHHLRKWLDALFRFWCGNATRMRPIGSRGVATIEEVFCKSVHVRPLVSAELRDEEVRRIELTEQQSRVLRALGTRTRAKICGGAGTGKTLLALERARALAACGARTLLLCYNRPLADHLRFAAGSSPLLRPMTFHQLCDWLIGDASKVTGRDLLAEARKAYPGADHYGLHLPYACALAVDALPIRFDAIVVDEAQDFAAEYWLPLEMLLADPERSTLLVFFDQNQAVYRVPEGCPIDELPLVLTLNCRNTRRIHQIAYQHFQGDLTDACDIEGSPITSLIAPTLEGQAELLRGAIAELIEVEKVDPEHIAVLTARQPPEPSYALLAATKLPRAAKWSIERHRTPVAVTVDTVRRYKGLESGVVFLWGVSGPGGTSNRELNYVALSRAKSRLVLVGTKAECASLEEGSESDSGKS